jgi:hypothetical protein
MATRKHAAKNLDQSAVSTISTAVTSTVTLGQSSYGDTVTVTATGSIMPSVTGATAVLGTGPGIALINMGSVIGGAGGEQADDSLGGAGVSLSAGLISNAGTIAGGAGGIGEVYGSGGDGVSITGGTLTNGTLVGGEPAYGAVISGGAGGGTGVAATGSALTNDGEILGGTGAYPDGVGGTGVSLDSSNLLNQGIIYGGTGGFDQAAQGGAGGIGVGMIGGTLSNTGTIGGGDGRAASDGGAGAVLGGGDFDNQGVLLGGNAGQVLGVLGADGGAGLQLSAGLLTNEGIITGGQGTFDHSGGAGVSITGGTVINSGTIVGGAGGEGEFDQPGFGGAGLYLNGGTVVNAGTITAGLGSPPADANVNADAVQFGTIAGTLAIDPGAIFNGAVVATAGVADVLQLAGTTAATLTGIGTQFADFSTIDFATGATWSVAGGAGAFATGQAIEGFAAADAIILDGFVETGSLYVSGTGLELDSASGSETLDITGAFDTQDFAVSTDGTNTTIELCYLRGTRILTPTGEVPIETLRAGDRVVTRFGGIQPVRWIGRQRLSRRMQLQAPEKLPVRIAAGALGDHLPARDLYVSPGHSMLLDNVLVLASVLVNGITVTQAVPSGHAGPIDYLQIELAAHDCIIAEGTWSETFADGPGLRDAFDNAADFYALFPDAAPPEALALCAPRPDSGAALQAALRPIAARAALGQAPGPLEGCLDGVIGQCRIEGWAMDLSHPRLPVLLDILLRGERLGSTLACEYRHDLKQAGKRDGHCAFAFTSPRRLTQKDCAALTVQRATDASPLHTSDACSRRRVA